MFAVAREASAQYPVFRFGGFAGLEAHTSSDANSQREGLDLIELVLYPTAQFSDRWSALAEVVVRRVRGREPSDNRFGELDLERLYVAYEPSDDIRIEAGEIHTGILQWNEREHRSRMLQTPIDVPAIARAPQDDGAWPLRLVGVSVGARVAGPLGLRYSVALGNGPGTTRDAIPILGHNRAPAGLFSISLEPSALQGLQLGVAAYAQRIPLADPLRERDVTLSLGYVDRGTEVRAEWAQMIHTSSRTERRFRSAGYYILLSQRLSGRASRWRPYLLVDHLNIAPGEELLRDSTNENAWSTGLRWDVTSRFTVKGELRSQRGPSGDREGIAGLQLGFSF
jgi:hypothetical protein